MFKYFIFLWFISVVATIYSQLAYAKANYPTSRKWKGGLFVTAFISGALGTVTFVNESPGMNSLLLAAFLGVFSGVLFTFSFPSRMQTFFPARQKDQD